MGAKDNCRHQPIKNGLGRNVTPMSVSGSVPPKLDPVTQTGNCEIAAPCRDLSRASYNHAQYLDERRRMMQAWADHLDDLRSRSVASSPKAVQGAPLSAGRNIRAVME